MLRAALTITGIVLAALGGVIAYRAAFLAPSETFVVSEAGSVREVSHTWRALGGFVLLIIGAAVAFLAARRRAEWCPKAVLLQIPARCLCGVRKLATPLLGHYSAPDALDVFSRATLLCGSSRP